MRIRSRLFLLVVSVLVPAVVGTAIGIGYVYTDQQDAYRQSLREMASAMSLALEKEIARREALLHTLANSPALEKQDLAGFYAHARKMASSWETTIFISDLNGQQLINTRVPFEAMDLPASTHLMALRQAQGPKGTIVSDVYFAPIGKNHSFAVQLPVEINNELRYYIGMGSFTQQLQTLFSQSMPDGWIGTVIDRNGIVAARTHEPEKWVGNPVREDFIHAVQQTSDGFIDGITLNTVEVTGFFSKSPLSEWTFVVNVPRAHLEQAARRATLVTATIFLLLLALASVVAMAFGRRIARPVDTLRLAAERLGHGEVVTAEPSGILEMDAVHAEMARASEKLRRATAELEQRVAEAVEMAEKSQRAMLQGQKLEALGRLTGGIAHDFNNVLQTLTTGLQLAYLSSDQPRARSAVQACQHAVKRAAELTRKLMAFARVQDAHLTTIDVVQQITEIAPMLKGALREDIAFQLNLPDHAWHVKLDALQFELALLNLVVNARDAMPSGGTIRLDVSNEVIDKPLNGELDRGEYVRVCVADSGVGMSEELLAKVIDPFFTTKPVGQGTGMGLPQAYAFAHQAGGTLILDSQPGAGTRVILYLPKSDTAAVGKQKENPLRQPGIVSGKVLFVEDDALISDVVHPALEAVGLQVRVARDGEQALALLETGEPFDLVFSDIVMPGKVSGIALAQTVQTRFPAVRIILATGYSDRRVSLPGVRVLAKPYEMNDLMQAVRETLPQP